MPLTPRQTQIVDAALELIANGGIQNLTVKNIGGLLGITEPAVYRHFRSKAEIVKALIAHFDAAVPAEGCAADGEGFDALAAFARGRFRQIAAKPALAHVLFCEEIFMDDRAFVELLTGMMHRHRSVLIRHFREAQERGEVPAGIPENTLFRLFFGPVRLLVRQWALSGHAFDLAAEGDALIDALRRVLKRPPQ